MHALSIKYASPAAYGEDVPPAPGSTNTALLVGGLALGAGLLIFGASNKRNPIQMARKKATRRRRRSSTAVAQRAAPRRRTLSGVRRRSRGRVRAVKGDVVGTLSTVAEVSAGGLLAMVGIGAASKLVGNYYGRAALVGAVGVGVAMAMPKLRNIGVGIAAGAAMGAGAKALSTTTVGANLLNGMRKLSDQEYKAILQKVKRGGTNGQPMTLSRAGDPVPTLNYAESAVVG